MDFEVQNHGSIFLLIPQTDDARTWAEDHLPDDAQMLGDAYAVEHRYIGDIVNGIVGRLSAIWQQEAPGMPEPNFTRIMADNRNNFRAVLNDVESRIMAAGGVA